MPDIFPATNLNVSSATLEAWRQLSSMLNPSAGPGTGNFPAGKTQPVPNGSQWLRKFQLTLYKAGTPVSAPSPVTTTLATPAGNVVPLRPRDIPSTTLDPVQVTAAAPTPAQEQTYPGLDLSQLRCYFNIKRTTSSSPNVMVARVYNLSPQTMKKLVNFTRVQVQAGYVYAEYGIIFDGTVVQYVRGKEDPVNTYLEIWAGDGDTAYGGATVYKAYPPGTKEGDRLLDLFKAEQAAQQDLTALHTADAKALIDVQKKYVIAAGSTRDARRELQNKWNQDHFYDNGTYNVVNKDGYIDGVAVVLSPTTGLIGIPQVTPQGIQVKCLLNPKLRLAGRLKIDEQLLSGVAYIPGDQSGGPFYEGGTIPQTAIPQNITTVSTSQTGDYKIVVLNYVGDTRGQPWYCDLVCVAINSDGTLSPFPGTALNRSVAVTSGSGSQPTAGG